MREVVPVAIVLRVEKSRVGNPPANISSGVFFLGVVFFYSYFLPDVLPVKQRTGTILPVL